MLFVEVAFMLPMSAIESSIVFARGTWEVGNAPEVIRSTRDAGNLDRSFAPLELTDLSQILPRSQLIRLPRCERLRRREPT